MPKRFGERFMWHMRYVRLDLASELETEMTKKNSRLHNIEGGVAENEQPGHN
jgi:hypothetical protein